jgi:anti-sigma regulatory factor (Ser/Thr protein kinase)
METSASILFLGASHLLMLIVAVYVIAYVRIYCSVSFSETDVLILAMQLLNLALLLRSASGDRWSFLGFAESFQQFVIVQCVFLSLLPIRIAWSFRKGLARRRTQLMPQSIREAIDALPGGICFSTPSGRPILANRKMNELVHRLTGHTIMNARATWDDLLQWQPANGCLKLDSLPDIEGSSGRPADEHMFFSLPDDSIWKFRKEELAGRQPHYTQLEAMEISDLYRNSQKLRDNNLKLAEQHGRQQKLLANIVEINREKETLSTKMRIHDDLGRSILMTKQHLENHTAFDKAPYLAEIWDNTIRNLSGSMLAYPGTEASPEEELQKVADMIGCRIDFLGERPAGRKASLLFYAAVREALSNAVAHGNADRLTVRARATGKGHHVEITDNGTRPVSGIVEGSGLGNLRRRLEQEGASLKILNERGVVLVVALPSDEKDLPLKEA